MTPVRDTMIFHRRRIINFERIFYYLQNWYLRIDRCLHLFQSQLKSNWWMLINSGNFYSCEMHHSTCGVLNTLTIVEYITFTPIYPVKVMVSPDFKYMCHKTVILLCYFVLELFFKIWNVIVANYYRKS